MMEQKDTRPRVDALTVPTLNNPSCIKLSRCTRNAINSNKSMPSAALDQSIQVELNFLIVLLVDNSEQSSIMETSLLRTTSSNSHLHNECARTASSYLKICYHILRENAQTSDKEDTSILC
jgi:hypothetical protein